MMRSFLPLLLFCVAALPAWGQGTPVAAATGFFHARQMDQRWGLVDPQGRPFVSMGVDAVCHHPDETRDTHRCAYAEAVLAKYGSVEAWRKAAAEQLFSLGFNTLGSWSEDAIAQVEVNKEHLAYAPNLELGVSFVHSRTGGAATAFAWMKGIFPDVFDPDFAKSVQALADAKCRPLKEDPHLLGWFTDNELCWGPDWRGRDELLVEFLNAPLQSPGREAALGLLEQRYPAIARFNEVWSTAFASWDAARQAPQFVTPAGASRKAILAQNAEVNRTASNDMARAFIADCDAFVGLLAERYFQITAEAIKAADPNHMVMGCRFAYVPAAPVIAAAGKYCDVISFNSYSDDPTWALNAYTAANKPLLIGEFGFRARDSGLPNTKGAGLLLATQADRARCYEAYVRAALRHPYFVGCHWFKHADEPKEGRFDGEDSNYGIVNIDDRPYDVLSAKMKEVNAFAVGGEAAQP